ncbi:hypothetical protein SARI_02166 [Salmonella enterica subsp. arizonae serovar 62:z4,z23:-]|uniref:Uncharacterized protein n=1 Tax=Salmonella arizonae (strain ATCC BAA-731 / CDC346-86 / RSK2980) TaxID=41514 RepID=A9MJH9_SALAR|nr:hypothetical protein SARI_02166 [Salmonella enterica subsp. arizonae serovar 62:z4,z23:-]
MQIGEDLFYHQFTFAVGALRRAGRKTFDVRNFGLIAINGGGGAKNKVFNVGRTHGADQPQRTVDVVVIVLQRPGDRFADGFQAGKVNHGIYSVIVQNFGYKRFVANIAFDKGRVLTAQTFDNGQYAAFAVAEVIEDDDVMTILQQLHTGMTSYVTATTCNQYSHNSLR